MRTLGLFWCCAVLAGCSRATLGTLPIAADTTWSKSAPQALHGAKKLTFFYDFKGGSDGVLPTSGLLDINGALYGTTQGGGSSGRGTVFRISPGLERVVYSFKGGSDGSELWSDLIEVDGALYGTTYQGGDLGSLCASVGCGTVFKLTLGGAKSVLYSFKRGTDGGGPVAGLTDVGGTFYGTTYYGGLNDEGTVFKITPSGETVLHSFGGGSDGASPEAGLTYFHGALYGTTRSGGSSNNGTVFKITPAGVETVIHSFASGSDGAQPVSDFVNLNDTLYGTTTSGGNGPNCGSFGCGTIYKVAPSGTVRQIYAFKGGADGAGPGTSLLDVDGTLYGATSTGGTGSGCGSYGCGTVFKITVSGAETVLYSFTGGTDGANPQLGHLIDINGILYGTTSGLFTQSSGSVFGLSL